MTAASDVTAAVAPSPLSVAPEAAVAPASWSVSELATLASIAETFVRGNSVRRANLAAGALEAAAEPGQVRQLRFVLRLVESRVANLLLFRKPVPFRDMPPAEREKYLLTWASSPLALRRSAFHALRKLLTFLAYADGAGGHNPHLTAIGYRPDAPPVTADPTPIRAWRLPEPDGSRRVTVDADVIVVGSGAGGGVLARDLARAGRSVVVLEAGPLVDERSMPRVELDAYDRLYLNHGFTTTWDGSVTFLAGGAIGGGTLVNWMTCIDSPAATRAEWTREHGIDGWDGAAAREDVAAIETELGVAPVASPAPKDGALLDAASSLGWASSRIRRNAPDCVDCGSCTFGCPRGTKQSGIRAHLAEAWTAGARIVPNVRVRRVLLGPDGGVEGVEATIVDADGAPGPGVPITIASRQVVVAAGALRTPAILERSGLDHPAIGRNLRIHPVPVVAARVDGPVEMWRGPLQGARIDEFLGQERAPLPYVIETAPGHPGLLALALPWEGTDEHASVAGMARFLVPLIAITRDGGEGRVRVTKHGGVRIDYRLDAAGEATLRHALGSMVRVARAAGSREIVALGMPPRWFGRRGRSAAGGFEAFAESLASFDFRPNRGTVFSAHQMGTARMGASPKLHACDPAGRVRLSAASDRPVRGLYVADGSLFPTGLGVNPMITIMALARRVGRTVLAES